MASRKTWVWIVVGVVGVGVVALIATAGAGIYFVTHHIQTEGSTSDEAVHAIDAAKAALASQRPLYEIDPDAEPRLARPLADIPSAVPKPEFVWMIAWDPDDQRLIKVSMPLWMLRFGRQRITVKRDEQAFDLAKLDLDVAEIERIGPSLLLDFKNRAGARVLVWTR
jgi:hypothetical protein